MNYIPENNYLLTNYTPIKGFPIQEDLCFRCERYYKSLFDSGITKTPFPPRCTKAVQRTALSLRESDFSSLTEYIDTITLMDPIAWAQSEFGWEARFYQTDMLSCSSKYKIYRCVHGDTPVLMGDGSWNKIKDISIGDRVVAKNDVNQLVVEPVLNKWYNGKKELFEVICENGMSVRITDDHELLAKIDQGTKSKPISGFNSTTLERPVYHLQWASLKSGLKIGTKIKIFNEYQVFGNKACTDDAILLGYMLTDGYFGSTRQTPKFTGNNLLYHNELHDIVKKKFGYSRKPIKREDSEAYDTYLTDGNKGTKNVVSRWFASLGLLGTKKKGKRIPTDIYTWNKESICLLINRMFSGDGCSSSWQGTDRPNSGELKLTSSNKDILEEIRLILLKLNIQSRLKYFERDSKVTHGRINFAYDLVIGDGLSILNFFKEVGYIYGKEEQSKKLEQSVLSRQYYKRHVGTKAFSLSRIKEIKSLGEQDVYDIEVKTYHNFIANGIVTHNCGRRIGKSQAMIIETLHHVVTNKNHSVLLIAPYERQVTALFDEMHKLINTSINIKGSLARYTKTPSRMDFNNGSKILGFSAGATSSSGSDKIRGQDANLIIIDEIDTLDDKDIDAVMAIIASHPDCKLVAASTPRGWRRRFYTYVTDKNLGFKEFWFISAESPSWTPETEQLFKDGTDPATYAHEYNADFMELEEGVFKARHLNASIQDYDMSQIPPDPNVDYILGVDWNKSAGNHMVIVGMMGRKIKLVRKIITDESTYTQTEAVNTIISLNRQWRFKYIFVDRGFGSVQCELLRKHTIMEPSSMLDQKLFDIAMNQHLDVKDPISGEPVKRNAKHFLIEQTRKMLEDGYLVLPKSEDTTSSVGNKQMGLVQQMRNFRIEAVSVYGLPRYSQGEEHTLAAFYLACGGYYWKEGDLKSIPYVNHIASIEISDEINPYIHPSVVEREQDRRNGWKLERTSSQHSAPKPPKSRSLDGDVTGKREGFNYQRKTTNRNSMRQNSNYRRGNI